MPESYLIDRLIDTLDRDRQMSALVCSAIPSSARAVCKAFNALTMSRGCAAGGAADEITATDQASGHQHFGDTRTRVE